MYRKNGKQQSCEPCRKWKIRCDHTRPVCQRCLARNIDKQCFYHSAPMTRRQKKFAGAEDSASNDPGPLETDDCRLVIIYLRVH